MKIMNNLKKIFFLVGSLCVTLNMNAQTRDIYVTTGEVVNADGSKKSPFTSLKDVTNKIKELRKSGNNDKINVLISSGLYELDEPITFTEEHNGIDDGEIVFRVKDKGKVVLSGGRLIKNWIEKYPNHWVATLPEVKAGTWYFRQLFAGHKRLQRAKTPNEGFFLTNGCLSRYRKTLGKYTWGAKDKDADYWLARCGFSYRNDDIKYWDDWKNAEILTFHSWESSWQSIQSIDEENKDVYFTSPCRYPVGTFGSSMRYRIENIASALDMPGEWFLDKEKGELHLLTEDGQNPNDMEIHAPKLTKIVDFDGTNKDAVANVRFENIQFHYTDYKMGLYDIAPNWPSEIQKSMPYFPTDIRPGFTGAQAAPTAGSSFELTYAHNISFEECGMRHLGAIAVNIGKGCNGVTLNGCEIADIGAGGVYIGMDVRLPKKEGMPESDSPKNNKVSNCFIHSLGHVHPAAVGVWIAQASNNEIVNNEISYVSYSGTSLGWTWGVETNYTRNNYLARNYIHHTAQVLGDAAGMYSLGDCSGCIYDGNFIDQIYKGKGVAGVVDGMGFDECSSNITIRNQVVGKVSGKVASFGRRSSAELQKWENNNFNMDIARPVIKHKPGMEASSMTVVAEFKPVSTFINLSGWLEQRWVMKKNGDSNEDGFIGIYIQGKQAVGCMNIGGGKSNFYEIKSDDNIVIDDSENQALLNYDGEYMRFYFNGIFVGERKVNKKRSLVTGELAIAPISANSLRNGIDELSIYSSSLTPETINKKKSTFTWKAPEVKFTINEDKVKKDAGPKDKYRKNFIIED